MTYSRDFIAGYRRAMEDIGHEGDHLGADWHKPYIFLSERLAALGPTEIGEFHGIKIVADPSVIKNMVEIHHGDGRVDYFKLPQS